MEVATMEMRGEVQLVPLQADLAAHRDPGLTQGPVQGAVRAAHSDRRAADRVPQEVPDQEDQLVHLLETDNLFETEIPF